MKREELEKEAEGWLNKWELCNKCENKVDCISNFSYCKKVVLQSYLASAEPRERRIEELEKENAELKVDNDARKFAMAMSEKVEKQLREENAKLKATNERLLESCEGATMMYEHLTKAKELLKEFKRVLKEHNLYHNELYKRTEQFLNSEVEK